MAEHDRPPVPQLVAMRTRTGKLAHLFDMTVNYELRAPDDPLSALSLCDRVREKRCTISTAESSLPICRVCQNAADRWEQRSLTPRDDSVFVNPVYYSDSQESGGRGDLTPEVIAAFRDLIAKVSGLVEHLIAVAEQQRKRDDEE